MARQLDYILVIDGEATCWRGEPPKGIHHRAGGDAWNSAAILAEILRRARALC
jgi:hypothetical protein